jgi:calcineurin-like phosphoesterase family protein
MDATIIENFNKLVKPEDQVYFLGDLTFEHHFAKRILDSVNGHWTMIWGNHDKWKKEYRKNPSNFKVESVHDIFEMKEQLIVLCHFPMVSWNASFHGSFHCYGHVHGRYDDPSKLSLDVGVDSWEFKPVHLDQVMEKINAKVPAWKEKNAAKI